LLHETPVTEPRRSARSPTG